jgi:tRNA(His) 5'-end guanylyltransferase
MKEYEKNPEYEIDEETGEKDPTRLRKGLPVLMRLDGKAFHTYTKGMKRPFDERLARAMWETTKHLCESGNIQGVRIGYTQSDEITLFINTYENENTDPWYDNNIQKMTSVSASLATERFNQVMLQYVLEDMLERGATAEEIVKTSIESKTWARFDSRVWTLPEYEVNNCFLWRQQDAIKNSISMVAQANFSHKSLQRLNGDEMKNRLKEEKGIIWEELPIWQQRGAAIIKVQKPKTVTYNGEEITVMRNVWEENLNTPLFVEDRNLVEQYVYTSLKKEA